MNGKKAKAMRKLAQQIAANKGLTERAYKFNQSNQRLIDDGVDEHGKAKKRVFAYTGTIYNAADTTRGQYRALKAVVRAAYGRAAA